MKVKILRNIGSVDLRKLGATDRDDLLEKAVVDVPNDLGQALIELKLAEPPNVRGVGPAPSVRGVTEEQEEEESPVDGLNVTEAVPKVLAMRSKEKLQHIIDNDKRATVVEAAKKRIAEL
jgi:hypothetical protein